MIRLMMVDDELPALKMAESNRYGFFCAAKPRVKISIKKICSIEDSEAFCCLIQNYLHQLFINVKSVII